MPGLLDDGGGDFGGGGDFSGGFSAAASAPSDPFQGYGNNLSADQKAMVQQQGWFPQPTMSLPTGQSLQQPTGYSGLTPAQAATVQGLGYYTGTPGNAAGPNIFDKLGKLGGMLGGQQGQQGQQGAGFGGAAQAANQAAAAAAAGMRGTPSGPTGGLMQNALSRYLGGAPSPQDFFYNPQYALAALFRGAPQTGTQMGTIGRGIGGLSG